MAFEVWTTSGTPESGRGDDPNEAIWDAFMLASKKDNFRIETIEPGGSYDLVPFIHGRGVRVTVHGGGERASLLQASPMRVADMPGEPRLAAAGRVVVHSLPATHHPVMEGALPQDALFVATEYGWRIDHFSVTLYGLVRYVEATQHLNMVGFQILRGLSPRATVAS